MEYEDNATTSYLRIHLTPAYGVANLFGLLTYCLYAALPHRLTPCIWERSVILRWLVVRAEEQTAGVNLPQKHGTRCIDVC